MKPLIKIFSIAFLAVCLLNSCNTGKKALQQGNYSDAVFQSVQRLRDNPDSKKSGETLRREVVSSGVLVVQIVDARTNKPKATQKFPGSFTWFSEWASFNGDGRALNSQQLELCRRKPVLPPPPQDLFLEFTKPIFEQLKGFLRNYYKNNQ